MRAQVNYSANAMGRTTSLTAFLSQWSSRSQADGPTNLARTTVPKLLLTYTADQSTFPSTRDAWLARRRRAHPQRRHRRRQPLPGGPAAAGAASGRCDRRMGARAVTRIADGRLQRSPPPTNCRSWPFVRAARTGSERRRAPPDRDRRRRPGRPHAGLRPGPARRARRAARRGRHGRRARRLVARHLLCAEEPGDLRAAGHLRAHRATRASPGRSAAPSRASRRSTTSTCRPTASRCSRPSSTCSSSTSSGSWSSASSNSA